MLQPAEPTLPDLLCDGLELVFVNTSEMLKSGALLSCCILHLNYDPTDLTKP